ncbi:MAG: CDP-alcohol phosphatidyltransferase family protein [Caulobacteraceae bacterium]
MKSSASLEEVTRGRPPEIEAPTNRWLVHPISRALVDLLIRTPVTPNQVSVASVFMAAAAAACYLVLAWPFGPLAGLLFQLAWHVLDGADGDLARRTGRASTYGELVDGICDHLSQALIYLAFALILRRSVGGWAWAIAAAAAISHFVQSNAYENGRKTYRRWVYGASWMRQDLAALASAGPFEAVLGRLYLAVAALSSGGEKELQAAMAPAILAGGEREQAARARYAALMAPQVRTSGALGSNARTLAGFLSMMAGSPIWYFLFEIVVLNLALGGLILWRSRGNRRLVTDLSQ